MRIVFILSLFLICLFPRFANCQTEYSTEQNEVYGIVVLIGNAWSQNNLDSLEKYIHADYKHTDVRGQILGRTSWLNYVKERKEKNVTNPALVFEDVQIKIYGNFALVTGINIFSGQAYVGNDKSNHKDSKIRFTQVLKKEDNTWKRISFQATYVDPAIQ
jgi:ketosteroid isomerase-like protein